MSATLLFIHGTGVRSTTYAKTVGVIERQVATRLPGMRLVGCFWGDAVGARLLAGGASIPGYDESGGEEPSEEDQLLALWTVLYTDPWYELRLLRQHRVVESTQFGQEPPAVALLQAVNTFEPPPEVVAAFEDAGLVDNLQPALSALRHAPELADAAATAPAEPLEHRRAIARALVAWCMVAAEELGAPAIDGATRDRLVVRLTAALKGEGLGVGEFLLRPLKGMAFRLITRKGVGDRGAISDDASPMAGDVLRFLANGEPARDFVRSAVQDAVRDPDAPSDQVYLLAHSLGGVICADLLARAPLAEVKGLITVGSQAPYLYELGAFPALSHPDPLPDHMPRWLNVYDRRDLLSYLGAPVFSGRVHDVRVDNGQPFPKSHSAYWSNPSLWDAVGEFVS